MSETKCRYLRYHFFAFSVAVLFAVLLASMPNRFDANIKGVVLQNREPISLISQVRNVERKYLVDLERMRFPKGDQLQHEHLGPLGFSSNFFVELETKMWVLEDGEVEFQVISDDGFRLSISGGTVCEFPEDRKFLPTRCSKFFKSGTYSLRVSYFQGGGPLGLEVFYGARGTDGLKYLGENSKTIRFLYP